MLFDPDTKSGQSGGEELISDWKQSETGILWLDIEGGDAEHDELVLTDFGIHPLAIQDALRPRHPPKIERFDNYWFILMRGLDADSDGIDFGAIQLSIFVGERFLLSRHSQRSVSANWLFDQLKRDPAWMAEGPGSLAVRLSNRLARRYVELLLELEPRLDEIEEEMFENPDDELLSELTQYRSRLRKLTRIANYHHQIASILRETRDSLFDASLSHRIVDLYEQIERTQSLSSLFYQIATDLTDGYLGISSHRLNRVMQILTIITVIFVPLTFLAGIYGMNFQNMPELSTRTGYFVVIGIMFVIAVMQLIYFRRKRWM
jgi:magnesium transporter